MTDTMTYIELEVPHYQQNQNTEITIDVDVETSVKN